MKRISWDDSQAIERLEKGRKRARARSLRGSCPEQRKSWYSAAQPGERAGYSRRPVRVARTGGLETNAEMSSQARELGGARIGCEAPTRRAASVNVDAASWHVSSGVDPSATSTLDTTVTSFNRSLRVGVRSTSMRGFPEITPTCSDPCARSVDEASPEPEVP